MNYDGSCLPRSLNSPHNLTLTFSFLHISLQTNHYLGYNRLQGPLPATEKKCRISSFCQGKIQSPEARMASAVGRNSVIHGKNNGKTTGWTGRMGWGVLYTLLERVLSQGHSQR